MQSKDMYAIRQAMGLSRAKLGDQIGVHPNTINKWERGDNPIPEPVARLLRRLANEHQKKSSGS